MRFFFYGTLLDRRVRRAVIGPAAEKLDALPAVLHGWRRVRLEGRHYPVIVPASGTRVQGCIFGPLSASAIAKLSRFEGTEYRMTEVKVADESGVAMAVRTFIGSGRTPATSSDWHFDDWERRQRSVFLRGIQQCRGGPAAE